MKWLPKHIGFDYDILYKNGSENKDDDALYRIPTSAQLLALAPSLISSDYVQHIMDSCRADVELQKIITDLEDNPQSHKHYTLTNGQLIRKGKLVVGNNEELRQQLLQYFHSDPSGGHSGVCQINKPDLSTYPGLLQPLPIPKLVWSKISMDFIEGLPSLHEKTSIFVVVDKLKRAQNRMKTIADAKRTEREFEVGQWILEKVGQVAYHLDLPTTSHIHPLFHVSQLKKYKGPIPNATAHIPQCNEEGEILSVLVEVFDRRLGKVGNIAQVFVLIKWSNGTVDDSTWELHSDIVKRFPDF
ncbi:retrotransposable element Tf2 [Tanacetum coccineum]